MSVLDWKPLKISTWNFIQILSIIWRLAEHKNHNSCLYSYSPLNIFKYQLHILNTIRNESSTFHVHVFTHLCTLYTFWVHTPLQYQNLTFCTKLHHSISGGRHQFSHRKQILVYHWMKSGMWRQHWLTSKEPCQNLFDTYAQSDIFWHIHEVWCVLYTQSIWCYIFLVVCY